ncbi:SDR family NAD(P)-dependent oxidoreductase [Nocardia suismassiliense]|uniref:SDR family NAD(P)-dependent oxidoreductase n=1 Tax=Nocardia suismassiliense TaxID=2077092 RepID=UPI000D1E1E7F|nr:SDR family NAD(P)-dependent oxidoreductase [Nocardia suismassiliense]
MTNGIPGLDPADNRIDGKVALITGVAGGQGRAASILFARAGASVVGCDLVVDGTAETARLVREAGGVMSTLAPCDVSDPAAVAELIEHAVSRFGGLDIVYPNAATARFGAVESFSLEDWRFTLRQELETTFLTCQTAWPALVERGGGSIITVGSIAGHRGSKLFATAAHAAAKGAVIALTRQLAIEGAPHGIRANSISPGPVRTPAMAAALVDAEMAAAVAQGPLLDRIGEPADVAHTALFLASSAAAWITGVDIRVDGGMTAWA